MNKDIIYIDVEDDITAIIGKIKASNDKIIALVPPKRVGILQSAVNLRLLNRMAQTNNKRLVLITNNQALVALSANIGIPVAKNLQSKPELPEISALDIDEGEDVIDGASLPVGDHVKISEKNAAEEESVEDAIETIDIDDKAVAMTPKDEGKEKPKAKSLIKVPDFSSFRKKLFIGIAAGVVVISFLVWATIFAPSARIIVTAKTSPAVVSTTVTLGGNAETDVTKGTIKTVTQQVKKDVSVDFDATGDKDLGSKAVGTMQITRTSISSLPLTVPVGTSFTNGSLTFYSTEAATLEGTQIGPDGPIQDTATVNVQAANPGESYNISARAYSSDKSGISASGSAMTGGTTKLAKVPTKADIQTATTKLILLTDEEVKAELVAKFVNGEVVIDDSFLVESAAPVSAPKEGEEAADGKAKLTVSTTYTITAIAKSDIQLYLKSELDKQLASKSNQRVYNDGIDQATLTEYNKTADAATVKVVTTAKIGPSISEADIKDRVKGKIYGDAQSALESIDGINSADINFSYFWVRTVPGSDDKISVEFRLEDAQ